MAVLLRSLETATDLADLRADLAGFQAALSGDAGRIDDSSIQVPYLVKGGLDVVMPEIEAAGSGGGGAGGQGSG